jgi:flagellar biosynthesis protein FlhA
MPFGPFLLLSVGFLFLGRYSDQQLIKISEMAQNEVDLKAQAGTREETVESLLHLDTLALEVGVELVSLVDSQQDGEVLDRIVSARKQFAQDIGIIVPMVMIRDNISLKPDEYQILLKGNPIGKGRLQVRRFLAMDAGDVLEPIEGIRTKEPAYGLDATWILPSQRDEANFRGYTVVNPATVIVTHLTKLIQEAAPDLIGRQEVYKLVEGIKQGHEKVVDEVIATDRLTLGDVVRVLQNLLSESVSIRDMLTIFETLADYCKTLRNPDALTRYVRKALGRSIVKKYLNPEGVLVVVALDRALEDILVAGITQNQDDSTSMSIEPEFAQKLLNNLADGMKGFEKSGTQPVLMCGARVRWDLRKLVSRFIPGLTVLAFDEIPADIPTNTINTISI